MSLDLGNTTAQIVAIFYNKSFTSSTSHIPEDANFGLILDRTNFYAESGGQEYDTGNIVVDGVADFDVNNVQVYNGYVLHTGRLKYGLLSVGDDVVASYDEVRCQLHAIRFLNHSILSASSMATAKQPYCHAHTQLCSTRSPWRSYRSEGFASRPHKTAI